MRLVNPIQGGIRPATGSVRPASGAVRIVGSARARGVHRRWYGYGYPWYGYPWYWYPYYWYRPWYYPYPYGYGYGYPYQERVVCERITGDAECPNNTIVRYNADGSKTCCPPY